MASRAPTRAPARRISPEAAVVPASLSRDDLMAMLGQMGAVAQEGGDFHRMKLDAGALKTNDGQVFFPRHNEPSLRVRIVKPPVYYNAFFLAADERDGSVNAERIGRPDLNGRYCRKYDDPAEQAADTNQANEVYDDIARLTGQRGQFKADLEIQIVPESGELTGEETIYTLTLSTTSIFEFRGTSRDPSSGSVSDTNFMVRLSELAIQNAIEAGLDEAGQKTAVVSALTSFRLGGVIADLYLMQAENDNRSWWVISFVPVYIDPVDGNAQLEAGSSNDVPI